jgi:hypothetical protein
MYFTTKNSRKHTQNNLKTFKNAPKKRKKAQKCEKMRKHIHPCKTPLFSPNHLQTQRLQQFLHRL